MHSGTDIRYPWWPYALGVGILHLLGVLLLLVGAGHNPAVLGMGFLAYTFGLRHAFDADHIAAIDNTVRKLVQQRENPSGIGFYFSLGHSTVVLIAALATALAAHWLQEKIPAFQEVGGLIGTLVSGIFLVVIAAVNLMIWMDIWRLFRSLRRGEEQPGSLDALLMNRGLVARLVKPLWRFIGRSWHVYPLGLLFGLGFDTASQISLLALSAGSTTSLSWSGILALPLLFAAGMSLMDTADGVFMTRAYGWALSTPLRKLYYNLTVTGLSVAVALVIGGIELLQVIEEKLEFQGRWWDWLRNLDLGGLGYVVIGLFIVTWAVSYGVWKVGRLEERWGNSR
ncbi:HoxN/HupN/NixA family nickel/cobalt transporter [Kyrpidia tusciae]|uniref:Nickel/cobalt efflux system n=1 Tax=Kyrpidia tusciae (strain DSM 2912 / NBRC 15312 / T2) TaxID=562970 RepID=D5WTD8_KYRT2|nr:HoxN/HupN/NixA family nickel/cobalt transporter [Kyrpidia tusciae]ADG07174.1 high-affinity nickel-transporter [Kyrpidia tusciae DSM 2912]